MIADRYVYVFDAVLHARSSAVYRWYTLLADLLSLRPHQVISMFRVEARVPFRILDKKKKKNRDESIDGCSGEHSLASMADQRLSASR